MVYLTLLQYDNLREAALARYERLRINNDEIKVAYIVTDDVYTKMIEVDPCLHLAVINGGLYGTYNGCSICVVTDILESGMFFPAVLEHPDYIYARQNAYYQGLQLGDVLLGHDNCLHILTKTQPNFIFADTGITVSAIAEGPINSIASCMWGNVAKMAESNKQEMIKQKEEETTLCDTKELDNFLSEFVRNKN